MKNKLSILAASAFAIGTMLTACNMQDKKAEIVQDAKKNVAEANLALNDAIKQFKEESKEIITANEKRIVEIKVIIAEENAENQVILEKKLAEMEKRNTQLKAQLAAFKNDGSEKWNAFKVEFNHDIKELGKAFSDFTVKNTN